MSSGAPIAPSARWFRAIGSLVRVLSRLLFRIEVHGHEHLPEERPLIYAPTHRSFLDTPFLSAVVKEPCRFLAKESIFRYRPFNVLFRKLGAIPVDRERGGHTALRSCLRVLAAGESLVVFPEGTRNVGPTVGPVHDGCAYLAIKSGALIVPIAIGNSERVLPRGAKFPRFAKVRIEIGAPISPQGLDARGDAARLTAAIESELQLLLDHASL